MEIVLQMKKTSHFHSSIQTSFNLSIHLLIHPPTSPRCFTLNISPFSMGAGAFHYIHTNMHIQYVHTHTHTHTHTQTLKYGGFIRSKPQEGRWRIRDKPAAWSRACSPVRASCRGSSTPGELVLPGTSRPAALMLWLQRLSEKQWKLERSYRRFH